jgi:hypothetical protein
VTVASLLFIDSSRHCDDLIFHHRENLKSLIIEGAEYKEPRGIFVPKIEKVIGR